MNQSIQNPCQTTLERTCKLEAKKHKISRKYDSSYLKFGFIEEPGNELDPRLLCIVCCASLSNDAMKPSKLEKHLQSKHPNLAKKPLEYF